MKKEKDIFATPINFESLAEINFKNYDIQKALVLLYLFIHCKKGDFFVSAKWFEERIGIKKAALKRIVADLENENLIESATRGTNNITHYFVKYEEMASERFLLRFYKKEEVAAGMQPYFQKTFEKVKSGIKRKTRGQREIPTDLITD